MMQPKDEIEGLLGEKELFGEVNGLIDRVSDLGDDAKEELSNLAQRLPSMLMNSGVLMTMTYLLKRCMGERENQERKSVFELINSITKWLKVRGLFSLKEKEEEKEEGPERRSWGQLCERLSGSILDELLKKEMKELALISNELLRYSEVLKVLTQARIGQTRG